MGWVIGAFLLGGAIGAATMALMVAAGSTPFDIGDEDNE